MAQLHRQAHVRSAVILVAELACIGYVDIRNSLWLTVLVVPPLLARALMPFVLIPPLGTTKKQHAASSLTKRTALLALGLALAPALVLLDRTGGMPRAWYGVLLLVVVVVAVDFWLFALELTAAQSSSTEDRKPSLVSRVTYFWVLQHIGAKYWAGDDDEADSEEEIRSLPTSVDQTTAFARFTDIWHSEKKKRDANQKVLAWTLIRTFRTDLLVGSILQLAVYVGQVVMPVLVARILRQIGDQTHEMNVLGVYALASLGAVLVEQNQIDQRDRTVLKIGATLTMAAHGAVLDGRAATTDGGYTAGVHEARMLAQHVAKLSGTVWLPLRVLGGLYVFYRQVGWWAVVAGLSFILLYLPLRSTLIRTRTEAQARAAQATSERISLVSRMVDSIVPLRLLNWDGLLARRVQRARETDELDAQSRASVANSLLAFTRAACRSCGPIVSLFIYSVVRQGYGEAQVTADQVYVVQAILRELFPLIIDAPHAFDGWWAAQQPYANISRILLSLKEKKEIDCISEKMSDSVALSITGGCFAWPASTAITDDIGSRFALTDVHVSAQVGKLVCVVGKAGSGKSSLLAAILGDMPPVSPISPGSSSSCCVKPIGYVAQNAWLMDGTVRDNVLFGCPYDIDWFRTVVDACELAHDLDQWALGELTPVGTAGSLVSGGQRMRIALARAVYARPSLVLLDDVLAMVDAPVGRRIVANVLCGPNALLNGATRVVVASNSSTLLGRADAVWVVDRGTVKVSRAEPSMIESALIEPPPVVEPPTAAEPSSAIATPPNSHTKTTPPLATTDQQLPPELDPEAVGFAETVKYLVHLCGWAPVLAHTATVALQCVAASKAQLWLSEPQEGGRQYFFLCTAWWAADVVLDFGAQLWTDVIWRRAIFVKSHRDLVHSVFQAPLRFFALAVPGSLLELFTRSQTDIDTQLPQQLATLALFAIKLVFESWAIIQFDWKLLAAVSVVIGAMWIIKCATRAPLTRFIASIAGALPMVHHHVHEAAAGAPTLRAFGQTMQAREKLAYAVDLHARAQRAQDAVETWIDLSMDVLRESANIVAFAVALAAPHSISLSTVSMVNLCVTFHLARLQHLIRHAHALCASVEKAGRYVRFTRIKPDHPLDRKPWRGPTEGRVTFDRVSAQYGGGAGTWALHDMSFSVLPGQHIGIVGRTGAGKTSIAMALFGLLAASAGTIAIDGRDIRTLDPCELRSHLAIVPQDAQTLPGAAMTVRDNLDPHRMYSDEDDSRLLHALQAVGLDGRTLDESPELWSAGQKQMLALARALLSRARVLVLDEATAHVVDPDESAMLLQAIRRHFANRTVITIAHRLDAVMHCHRVLVVRDGYVCEDGTPSDLLALKSSLFAGIAQIAQQHHNQSGTCLLASAGGPPTPP
ncbi:ATP-binding cassette glutathione S-conjugate transporter ycf1 [Coemansia sp. RSA 1933]|nr:ATP-binding cassette glutathione S-conjugate transporter ycf1 [Coemansia sp. RSA 1933]